MATKAERSGGGGRPGKADKTAAKAAKRAEKRSRKEQDRGKQAWKMLSRAVPLAAGMATTKALNRSWTVATGRKPPDSPENPEVATREALAWAGVTGLAMALTKTYVKRRAAGYWVKSTGRLPPGMKADRRQAEEIARQAP